MSDNFADMMFYVSDKAIGLCLLSNLDELTVKLTIIVLNKTNAIMKKQHYAV